MFCYTKNKYTWTILLSFLLLIYNHYHVVFSFHSRFMNPSLLSSRNKNNNIYIQEINNNRLKRISISSLFVKKRQVNDPIDQAIPIINNNNDDLPKLKASAKSKVATSSNDDIEDKAINDSIQKKSKVLKSNNGLTAKESKIKKNKMIENDNDKLSVIDDVSSVGTKSLKPVDIITESSMSRFLPNLDEDLAELEANLGVLGEEFRFDSENDDPLAALRRLEGLEFDVDEEEILKSLEFGDEKDSVIDDIELTDKQLQDALLELDNNNDFNIDELMRFALSKDSGNSKGTSAKSTEVSNAAKRSSISPIKKIAMAEDDDDVEEEIGLDDDIEDRDTTDEEEDEEEEEDHSDGDDDELISITMRRSLSSSSDDEDLMLDVIAPKKKYDEDDEDEEDDSDSILKPTKSKIKVPLMKKKPPTINNPEIKSKNIDDIIPISKSVAAPSLDDSEDLDLGIVDPPPLEEFKRLMESLGPESMFEDDDLFEDEGMYGEEYYTYGKSKKTKVSSSSSDGLKADVDIDADGLESDDAIDDEEADEYSAPTAKRATGIGRMNEEISQEEFEREDIEGAWLPDIYEGGLPSSMRDNTNIISENDTSDLQEFLHSHDDPTPWRVQIVSVVTNSTQNSTALEYVQKVYDFIKAGTNNDDRIVYQTLCFSQEDGKPFEELDDMIQMWLESYNTYHLIDGAAMKEAWGAIMPHIMLSEKNLNAILDQVRWALSEDQLDGALLTPRLRRVRFRGGAQEMTTGYNTEFLDSEFSVVSVR